MNIEKIDSVLTLYRVCTLRDKKRNYILESLQTEELSNEQLLEELVSHELNATTGRGYFYSFTFDLQLAKEYKRRNPENTEIRQIKIDLANLPTQIIGIYPIYSRDYLMSLMASTEEVIKKGFVLNPATGRQHSLLGILNTSQRTVSGWAYSMREIVIQCNGLQLEEIVEDKLDAQDEERVNSMIREYLFPKVNKDDINTFSNLIKATYVSTGCKQRYLIDRIETGKWVKVA